MKLNFVKSKANKQSNQSCKQLFRDVYPIEDNWLNFKSYKSKNSTMAQQQTQPQFKDSFIQSKMIFTHAPQTQILPITSSRLMHFPWTHKILRQKRSEQQFKRFSQNLQIFNEKSPISLTNRSHIRKQSLPSIPDEFSVRKKIKESNLSNGFGLHLQNPSPSHLFRISKNICSKEIHEDLLNSRILVDKFQNQNKKSKLSFKNLKIKSNSNLYRGNFSKFTRKELNHRLMKRVQLTADCDLSPWEMERNNVSTPVE